MIDVTHPKLATFTPAARVVFAYIAQRWQVGEDGKRLTVGRLAELVGVSETNVSACVARLEKSGLITVDRSRLPYVYTLNAQTGHVCSVGTQKTA